mmetsp:Transcript_22506/g.37067  ORF Transcript_22506/g.37067 Transcript_22506/m.37067 type:complete len:88 (-) Transcript_22506:882-1145(-)
MTDKATSDNNPTRLRLSNFHDSFKSREEAVSTGKNSKAACNTEANPGALSLTGMPRRAIRRMAAVPESDSTAGACGKDSETAAIDTL